MSQTSLFSIDSVSREINRRILKVKSRAIRAKEKSSVTIGKTYQKIEEVIGKIMMGESIHYVSCGEWSMHELTKYLLGQTGLAELYISTWSVSETAVRELVQLIESGEIKKLYSVLDWRVKIRRPEVYSLLKYNISDIRITTCHAKVTIIQNDTWSVAIVGSANFTNNPRIEAGVISCDRAIADFHKEWILKELHNSDPFSMKKNYESYKRKTK